MPSGPARNLGGGQRRGRPLASPCILSAEPDRRSSARDLRLTRAGSWGGHLWALVGTAGAVVGAGIAAILIFVVSSTPGAAFAGWTATPTRARAGQVQAAERACSRHDQSFASITSSGAPTVADTRGLYTFLVYAENGPASCIARRTGPHGRAISLGWGLGLNGGETSPAAPETIRWRQNTGVAQVNTPPASFVDGQAGSGVSAVTLELEGGSKVQATLQNGWFAAWWPGNRRVRLAELHDDERYDHATADLRDGHATVP